MTEIHELLLDRIRELVRLTLDARLTAARRLAQELQVELADVTAKEA